MTVVLSSAERDLVARYQLGARPSYYSASAQQNVGISDDMEAFIILMPPRSRAAVVEWLQAGQKKQKDQQDREALLGQLIAGELSDAERIQEEASVGLESYDRFQERYFENVVTDGVAGSQLAAKRVRFSDVPEVGQALSDLSGTVESFLVVRERAKHQQVVATIQQGRLTRGQTNVQQRQQVSSWAGPFTTYQNGNR